MTSSLASVVAMMLVEEGTIQLADPVSTYLPAFKNQRVSVAKVDAEFARVTYTSVPAEREMTVTIRCATPLALPTARSTVNAQVKDAYAKAGLYTPATIDFDVRGLTPAEEIERLAAAPLAHQPGTVWEYSLATDVLVLVVEAVAGKRLGALLAEKILRAAAHERQRLFRAAGEDGTAGAATGQRSAQADRRIAATRQRFSRWRWRVDSR